VAVILKIREFSNFENYGENSYKICENAISGTYLCFARLATNIDKASAHT